MNSGKRDPLDEALAGLPRETEPGRDLWPEIEAKIRAEQRGSVDAPALPPSPAWRGSGWGGGPSWKIAATILLVIGASITGYVLTRQSSPQPAPQMVQENVPTPALTVQPASFGSEQLGAQYASARAELDRLFEERMETFPPETREKLRGSLNDMRRATQEISDILAEHPSDPLLQQLLLTAYQNELKLLADVTDMTTPSPRVDL